MKRILLLGAGLSASTLIKYLLEQAVEVSDRFLGDGVIVSIEGRNQKKKQEEN